MKLKTQWLENINGSVKSTLDPSEEEMGYVLKQCSRNDPVAQGGDRDKKV
jgi:hypothetical protein